MFSSIDFHIIEIAKICIVIMLTSLYILLKILYYLCIIFNTILFTEEHLLLGF